MKSVFTSQNVLSVQPTMVKIEIWKHSDKEQQHAFFQTHSNDSINEDNNYTISSVHILKVVVDLENKISITEVNISLPKYDAKTNQVNDNS